MKSKKREPITVLTGYKSRQSAVTAAIRRNGGNVQSQEDPHGYYRVTPGRAPAGPLWVYVQPKSWSHITLIPYRSAK